jgi:hypothetical protein
MSPVLSVISIVIISKGVISKVVISNIIELFSCPLSTLNRLVVEIIRICKNSGWLENWKKLPIFLKVAKRFANQKMPKYMCQSSV